MGVEGWSTGDADGAEVGYRMDGNGAKSIRLASGPKVTSRAVEHRDLRARRNAELVEESLLPLRSRGRAATHGAQGPKGRLLAWQSPDQEGPLVPSFA